MKELPFFYQYLDDEKKEKMVMNAEKIALHKFLHKLY